ncbi:hypothetical protein KQI84_12985 [bacterium]|nr:hypothetical protein [bacterium]
MNHEWNLSNERGNTESAEYETPRWLSTAYTLPIASQGASPLIALSYLMELLHKSRRMAQRERMPRLTLVQRIRMFLQRHRRYRMIQKRLGVQDMVPYSKVDCLFAEVERHRWLEAEKAGRDIWTERNPADPEGTALQDWFGRYFRAWYSANVEQVALA